MACVAWDSSWGVYSVIDTSNFPLNVQFAELGLKIFATYYSLVIELEKFGSPWDYWILSIRLYVLIDLAPLFSSKFYRM
jgi:hypothetical protein